MPRFERSPRSTGYPPAARASLPQSPPRAAVAAARAGRGSGGTGPLE
jgi:hypothetical protein